MWFVFLSFGITFTTVDCFGNLTQHWPPAAMLWAVQKVWWANFLIYPQCIAGMLVSKLPRSLWSRHFGTKWSPSFKKLGFQRFPAICRRENRPTPYSGDVRQLPDASGCRDLRGPRPPQRKLQTVRLWRKANKCGSGRKTVLKRIHAGVLASKSRWILCNMQVRNLTGRSAWILIKHRER